MLLETTFNFCFLLELAFIALNVEMSIQQNNISFAVTRSIEQYVAPFSFVLQIQGRSARLQM